MLVMIEIGGTVPLFVPISVAQSSLRGVKESRWKKSESLLEIVEAILEHVSNNSKFWRRDFEAKMERCRHSFPYLM